jgi:hypothetical protein
VTGAKINKWTVTNTTLVQGLVWSQDGQTLWAVAKRGGFMDLCQLQFAGTNANAVFVDPVLHSGFTDIEALAILGTAGTTCQEDSFTKVTSKAPATGQFQLGQNVPNPFNPTTQIQFELPEAGEVELFVFDVRGRRVTTLFAGHADAGRHMVTWNGLSATGEHAASGVYYYTLRLGKTTQTRRMLLLK